MLNIQIKKLSELATIPTGNSGDAGFDLYSTEDYTLEYGERHLFKTDVALSIPQGYYGRICDRSGKALKEGLHTMAGQIDSTYRGNIGIVLINLNQSMTSIGIEGARRDKEGDIIMECLMPKKVEIKKGDRIAQIVFEKYYEAVFIEVKDLDQSIRNEGGFGSSGN